jgi:gamma-glutamylaminecyclotransferase
MTTRVFVYGSLLYGMGNHHIIGEAKFIRKAETGDRVWMMLDLGAFPGVRPAPPGVGCSVKGEVYEVCEATFKALDRLEGYPNFYGRQEVVLDDGTYAWMYILGRGRRGEPGLVPNGDWKAHLAVRNAEG